MLAFTTGVVVRILKVLLVLQGPYSQFFLYFPSKVFDVVVPHEHSGTLIDTIEPPRSDEQSPSTLQWLMSQGYVP